MNIIKRDPRCGEVGQKSGQELEILRALLGPLVGQTGDDGEQERHHELDVVVIIGGPEARLGNFHFKAYHVPHLVAIRRNCSAAADLTTFSGAIRTRSTINIRQLWSLFNCSMEVG